MRTGWLQKRYWCVLLSAANSTTSATPPNSRPEESSNFKRSEPSTTYELTQALRKSSKRLSQLWATTGVFSAFAEERLCWYQRTVTQLLSCQMAILRLEGGRTRPITCFYVQAYNDERQRHVLLLCDLRNCQWQYQRSPRSDIKASICAG
jgi:hypothetical protein